MNNKHRHMHTMLPATFIVVHLVRWMFILHDNVSGMLVITTCNIMSMM
jgi:hypothetical protein